MWKSLNTYEIRTLFHGKCTQTILIHWLGCIEKLSRSLHSLVRFCDASQLVNKNCSCALYMEYLCFLQDPRVSKKRSRYYTPGKELPHMRCFNCNEKGHLSQFCPEPKVHTFSWYLPFRYIWFFCLNRLKDMDHLYFHYYLVTAASFIALF